MTEQMKDDENECGVEMDIIIDTSKTQVPMNEVDECSLPSI